MMVKGLGTDISHGHEQLTCTTKRHEGAVSDRKETTLTNRGDHRQLSFQDMKTREDWKFETLPSSRPPTQSQLVVEGKLTPPQLGTPSEVTRSPHTMASHGASLTHAIERILWENILLLWIWHYYSLCSSVLRQDAFCQGETIVLLSCLSDKGSLLLYGLFTLL